MRLRFHDLRHSSATNLLNSGIPLVNVTAWLGHSSPTTTLAFYDHVDKSGKMQMAEKVAEFLAL